MCLIEASCLLCEELFECNADSLFIGGSTSRKTSSILLIPRQYNGLNNANPCIVRGSESLKASKFF